MESSQHSGSKQSYQRRPKDRKVPRHAKAETQETREQAVIDEHSHSQALLCADAMLFFVLPARFRMERQRCVVEDEADFLV